MSRNLIAGTVAVAIAALTAALYFVTASTLHRPLDREARALIKRVPEQAQNNATLTALDTYNKTEELSHKDDVAAALRTTDAIERARAANLAFQWFRGRREREGSHADLLALVDRSGAIVAMDGVTNPVAGEFKKDGKLVWKSLELATSQSTLMTEVWNYPGKGLLRVGVGTVVDPEVLDASGKPTVLGAVVLAYAITSRGARAQQSILGSHVAYFDGAQVFASSFKRGDDSEDTRMQGALAPILGQGDLVANALAKGQAGKFVETSAGGARYLVSAVRLPRLSLEPLPEGYPAPTAGILVLTEAERSASEFGRIGMFILVFGVVAIALAIGGVFLATQRILDQVDQIELGVAEIINGNLERTFRPVGEDLDGVANGLNVMMARLLGRPEPGEEEFDDDGNPIVSGRVEFDDADNRDAGSDLAALAQESEPDYYKRVYTEYTEARRASGNPDDVSFEGFIAKLRVNEGKLKAQYQCRAVRFRVVAKDGKVTLKPVPIV